MDEKPVVFILHGDDSYGMEQYVQSVVLKMGDPGLADLNTAWLDGRNASDEDLRTASLSIPFLTDRRLVVLRHPLAKLGAAASHKKFTALLDNLPQTTALILVVEDHFGWDRNARKYEWNVLKEKHWLVTWAAGAGKRVHMREFSLPKPAEMPEWIQKRARELKGQFTPQAASALTNLIGSDTQLASREIEKLLVYVDYARAVEAEDVQDCTAVVSQVNVFEMVESLTEGNAPRALKLLHTLLEEQDAIGLFAAMLGHFRAMLLAREYQQEGGNLAGFIEVMRKPKFMLDHPFRQAQRFSIDDLTAIYHRLAALDESLKNGQVIPDLALETFVVEVGGGIR